MNSETLKRNLAGAHIFVIESELTVEKELTEIFEKYNIKSEFFINIEKALDTIKISSPDIIFIAIELTSKSMLQDRLFDWAHQNKCPIVALLSIVSAEARGSVYEKRCSDYIVKPFIEKEILARFNFNLMQSKILKGTKSHDDYSQDVFFGEYYKQLDTKEVSLKKAKNYSDSQFAIIDLISNFVQIYRGEISRSGRRVQLLSAKIARYLAAYNKFDGEINETFVANIVLAGALYDCGMAAMPQTLLNSGEVLKQKDKEEMKKHTTIGAQMLEKINEKFPGNSMLKMAIDIAVCHHERYDGSGYPYGIKGNEIPLSARIVGIADVYDALISPSPHRQKFSVQGAINTISGMWKHQFDPEVLEAFLVVVDKKQDQLEQNEL